MVLGERSRLPSMLHLARTCPYQSPWPTTTEFPRFKFLGVVTLQMNHRYICWDHVLWCNFIKKQQHASQKSVKHLCYCHLPKRKRTQKKKLVPLTNYAKSEKIRYSNKNAANKTEAGTNECGLMGFTKCFRLACRECINYCEGLMDRN